MPNGSNELKKKEEPCEERQEVHELTPEEQEQVNGGIGTLNPDPFVARAFE